jgi:allose kinase
LEQFIDYLSIPIATEITLLDPECIILGGGVIHMEGFPRKMLEDHIYTRVRKPFPANNMSIFYSHQTQENGVIGAGIYGFRRLATSDYR